MSKMPAKYIWVLYTIENEDALKTAADLPLDEGIQNYASAVYTSETALLETYGLKIAGIWDSQHPDQTINRKFVERIP